MSLSILNFLYCGANLRPCLFSTNRILPDQSVFKIRQKTLVTLVTIEHCINEKLKIDTIDRFIKIKSVEYSNYVHITNITRVY